MSRFKEIRELNRQGCSGRRIAGRLGVSRNTMSRTLSARAQIPLTDAEITCLTESELQAQLFPDKKQAKKHKAPDFDKVHRQLKEHGVTLELLWREYQQEPRNADEKVYQYSRFCDLYHSDARQKGLTMALDHQPGE